MTTTETAEARARIERYIAWMNDDAGGNMPVSDEYQVTVRLGDLRLLLASLTPPAQGGEWNDAIEAAAQKVANSVVDGPAAVRGWFAARIRELAIPYASPGSEYEIDPVATEAHSRGMDEGVTFVLESLARQLGVTDYQQADGSEEWEGDVSGTVHNILIAASVVDDYTGRIAHLGDATPSAPTAERLRIALEAVQAAMLNGGDGAFGDYGWSMTKLNKARPLIRAALSDTKEERP